MLNTWEYVTFFSAHFANILSPKHAYKETLYSKNNIEDNNLSYKGDICNVHIRVIDSQVIFLTYFY